MARGKMPRPRRTKATGSKAGDSGTLLRFLWWNLNDFAHYEETRAGEIRWPVASAAYAAKCERLDQAVREVAGNNPPEILAFAEVTNRAITELRDRLFPGYEVFSLDLHEKSEMQVAVLYNPRAGLTEMGQLVVPFVPRGTRPMAMVDHVAEGHRTRFIACHWTARFEETSKHTRSDIARHLNSEIYSFIHDGQRGSEARHVVVIGDLNEEPFGLLEERLYASRDRARSRRREHYTDKDTGRVRLYNCSWRLLGERSPHAGAPPYGETAGTFYWEAEKSWHTFDQVIVTGSLLTEAVPFLDEAALQVLAGPAVLAQEPRPTKFSWNNGNPRGLSDHLPVVGRVVLRRDNVHANL